MFDSWEQGIRRIHQATFGTVRAGEDHRVFRVFVPELALIQRCDIKPPPPGEKFQVAELDAKLTGLEPHERIVVKRALARHDLL